MDAVSFNRSVIDFPVDSFKTQTTNVEENSCVSLISSLQRNAQDGKLSTKVYYLGSDGQLHRKFLLCVVLYKISLLFISKQRAKQWFQADLITAYNTVNNKVNKIETAPSSALNPKQKALLIHTTYLILKNMYGYAAKSSNLKDDKASSEYLRIKSEVKKKLEKYLEQIDGSMGLTNNGNTRGPKPKAAEDSSLRTEADRNSTNNRSEMPNNSRHAEIDDFALEVLDENRPTEAGDQSRVFESTIPTEDNREESVGTWNAKRLRPLNPNINYNVDSPSKKKPQNKIAQPPTPQEPA